MSSDFKVKVNDTFEFDFNLENTSKLDTECRKKQVSNS